MLAPSTLEETNTTAVTNVHVLATDRSAMAGDPTPGTAADPRAGQEPIDEPWLRGYPPILQNKPAFEVASMQRLLDGDQAGIKQKIRAILSQPGFRYYPDTDTPGLREQVLAWTRELARQDIGWLFLPKSIGGQDDLAGFMAAFETLGFHDVSLVIKFGVQFGLWGGSVLRLGTDYHHRKYLPATAKCDLLGCFAMTEIGHGSNVRELETTATYDPATGTFDLHSPTFTAGKNYIGNAGQHGTVATVFAQLETNGERHGVHAFVVSLRDADGHPLPGIRLEDNGQKLGLNGVDNGRIWFDHVRVPRVEMLDKFAQVAADGTYESTIKNPAARFFTTLGTLVGGRVSVGHSALSIAKTGLAIAVRYASRRRQFGADHQPETILLDYPAHQRRLLPLLANAYALDFAFKHLTKTILTTGPEEFRRVETLAAGLKAFSTWNTTHTLQTSREACGGEGYLAINRFAALKADSDIFTTFEGDNTVLMQLVAKNLLTDFGARFKGKSRTHLARWAVAQKLHALRARSPFSEFRTGDLTGGEAQLALFRFREESLLVSAGIKLRSLTSGGRLTPYAAFTAMQNELLALAFAHVERAILEQFNAAIRACPDARLQPILGKLRNLFALSHLERGRAWFLENRVLTTRRSRLLTTAVDILCADLRRHAVALVDSFGIPPACLAAPIALD